MSFVFLYLNDFFSPTSESVQVSGKSKLEAAQQEEDLDKRPGTDEHADDGDEPPVEEEEEEIMEGDFTKFTGRKKKLWEIRMKMVRFADTIESRVYCDGVGWIT